MLFKTLKIFSGLFSPIAYAKIIKFIMGTIIKIN